MFGLSHLVMLEILSYGDYSSERCLLQYTAFQWISPRGEGLTGRADGEGLTGRG
jgi:hypothetical protein